MNFYTKIEPKFVTKVNLFQHSNPTIKKEDPLIRGSSFLLIFSYSI